MAKINITRELDYPSYLAVSKFFQAMKCIHGGGFVDATLRRHSDLKKVLLDFESEYIIKLETELLNEES